ncbi:MAG TPA: cob(I)yrinic acid a,c-diamide adenosyltransferase [Anaerovoracaceae bacterium]|nr:cob(I)yrinic acid a,c-diamide adenosyltransferase [Anaerovoracaceae bacterium]
MLKVYTKRGDSGETDLFGGMRISKDDCRVECYGTMDEVNSNIGLAYSLLKDEDMKAALRQVQKRLFVMGAELASDEKGRSKLRDRISSADVDSLEGLIDRYQAMVTPRDGFLIPGGTMASAALHVARTVTRRFERHLIRMKKEAPVSDEIIRYANRMSDALFILAQAEEERALIQKIKERVMGKLKINDCADFSLSVLKKLAEAAEQKAAEMGVPIVFAAADQGGNLALLHRMEDSLLVSIDIAINKAYTSVALKMPTDELYKLAVPGGSLYGITTTNDSRIIAFGGGFPVFRDGAVIGAIGVSGGTVEQDMEIARHALSIL